MHDHREFWIGKGDVRVERRAGEDPKDPHRADASAWIRNTEERVRDAGGVGVQERAGQATLTGAWRSQHRRPDVNQLLAARTRLTSSLNGVTTP